MRKIIFIVLMISLGNRSKAQDDIRAAFQLPEMVISADASMDVDAFMTKVIQDSSFYQSFINLKYYPHLFSSELVVRNKGDKEKGRLQRSAEQKLKDGNRIVNIVEEKVEGKLYKRNGEHRYLTAQMYDEIFFPQEGEVVSPHIIRKQQEEVKGSKLEKYKSQLKKMMFNPGQEILSVPFIGDKMDVFSPEMIPLYDYSIYSAYTSDSIYCHVFLVEAKKDIGSNRTVIKRMASYFDKETMAVLSREYSLKNNTLLFEFDIWMNVQNTLQNELLLPKRIQYVGDWDIPFKKAEIIRFDIQCNNYSTAP